MVLNNSYKCQLTHNRNHILDIIVARSPNSLISNINIALPSFSDHSMIHFHIQHLHSPAVFETVERRSFIDFDTSSFENDLLSTELSKISLSYTSSCQSVDDLFSLYDSTMESLLSKYAPRRKIKIRKKSDCPWFDKECLVAKRLTRRHERSFLLDKSDHQQRELWRATIKAQRRLFQQKRSSYLRRSIEDVQGDGRTLWKSLHSLLTPPAETSSPLTPDELLDYFESKIENVRVSTEDAPPPNISDACPQSSSLAAFDEITPENVEKLLADSAVKQCELDSMPVRLIKTLRHAFAPILAMLINISLISGILPETHKRAIIRPRIKNQVLTSLTQPTTDQFPISHSYRSSSSVSSIDKSQITLSHTIYSRQRNLVSVDIIQPKLLLSKYIMISYSQLMLVSSPPYCFLISVQLSTASTMPSSYRSSNTSSASHLQFYFG